MRLIMNNAQSAIVTKLRRSLFYMHTRRPLYFNLYAPSIWQAIRCRCKAVGIHICNEHFFFPFVVCVFVHSSLSFLFLFIFLNILILRRRSSADMTWMRSRLLNHSSHISFHLRCVNEPYTRVYFIFFFFSPHRFGIYQTKRFWRFERWMLKANQASASITILCLHIVCILFQLSFSTELNRNFVRNQ